MKPFPQLSYEELQSEGYVVFGSPGKVTARLRELHDELGLGQLIGLFVLGGMTHEQAIHSMELFSTKVMSALRLLRVMRLLTPRCSRERTYIRSFPATDTFQPPQL